MPKVINEDVMFDGNSGNNTIKLPDKRYKTDETKKHGGKGGSIDYYANPLGSVSQAVVAGRTTPNANNLGGLYTVYNGNKAYSVYNGKNYDAFGNIEKYKAPKTNTPRGTGTSSYDALMAAFMEQNAAAREQMLNAITRQLEATKNAYSSAMQNTSNEYDNLIDQNEVRKARAKRILKERQANLGNRETGLGRQENLDLNLGYDAQTSNLLKTKQQAVDEIANLIIQAEAEAEQNKANVNNTYANALLQYKLANL